MKIIQYLPYSYHIHTWGLEKIAQTLCDWFNNESDISCLNIASDVRRWKGNEFESYQDTLFIPSFDLIYNFPLPKIWTREFWQHLNIIKAEKPDIIMTHTRFFVQSLIGGLVAKRLGKKRVHVEHGSWFVTWYPRYIIACAWLFDWTIWLWIFRQCNQIITISEMHKQFISKFTHKTPVVIYNPIDYIPQGRVRNTIPHIGFVGRLVPLKWVDLLIQALAWIQDQQRTCTIVGTGSEDTKLKQLTTHLWLSNRIIFVWADDRANRLHKFDIFVNPSHQEWLPTTVVEALIAWCVVVATDVGGTREISDGDDLIIIESWNIAALEEWLNKAFKSLQKAEISKKLLQNRFDPEKVLQQYKDILWTTIDQK